MLSEYRDELNRLKSAGWTVNLQTAHSALPEVIEARYGWLPLEIKQVITELDAVVSPDEKAWFLGRRDFLGTSGTAFKWNEWEQMSRDAADDDPDLIKTIQEFWDRHFPIVYSVKSGYGYFAICKTDFSIVRGEEPEFEEPTFVASSYIELLKLLDRPDAQLERWI